MLLKVNYSLLSVVLTLIIITFFVACQESPPKETTAKTTSAKEASKTETTTMVMSDMGRLQGTWEGQGPGGPCTITISNDTLTYRQPSSNPGSQFWYETVFTLVNSEKQVQLHATITGSNSNDHIGSIVVNTFKFESDSLFLGVLNSFEEQPVPPVSGDWKSARDKYYLKRVNP
ncbi:MAG: hypothetical protein AAFP70_16940 [Calditrichota bacterium]